LSFQLADLVEILVHRPSDSDTKKEGAHTIDESVRETLRAAVKEGIMYVELRNVESEELEEARGDPEFVPEDCAPSDLIYFFAHDMWRAAILKLVLDERKQQLHEAIASRLEIECDSAADDFVFQIRIFNHWRQSGNVLKAGGIALVIGKTYESLGLAIPSARLYQEAISVGTQTSDQLEMLIKLHIAAGRAWASDSQHGESVIAYQTALRVSFAC
jgi:predicted ATPase